jgi:protein SCO1
MLYPQKGQNRNKMKKILLVSIGLGIFSCKEKARKLPYYNTSDFTPVWQLPKDSAFHKIRPFKLIDQKGQVFTEKNIENKICVVDFIFTVCPGICPKMTQNMSVLQANFMSDKNIMLLSHSVTPQKDSAEVLAAYAKRKNIDYNKWRVLTGTKEEIYNLGRKYYFVEEDLGENRNVEVFLHTENFILIDKNRLIRGIYNGLDPNSIENLTEDIKILEEE